MKANIELIIRLIIAAILLQTLYFKFSAAPESVYIFSTLGIEPWGRIGSGLAELIAALLLLHPKHVALGGILASGIMVGAVLSHLAILGIEVQHDGGLLFGLACTVLLGGTFLTWRKRHSIPILGELFFRSSNYK
jgi:hypothetical protein